MRYKRTQFVTSIFDQSNLKIKIRSHLSGLIFYTKKVQKNRLYGVSISKKSDSRESKKILKPIKSTLSRVF
ncbi:hypothetical protein BN1318_1160011 [Staphylococcus capitis]|nr:hypothetical protein BN1318_1160011 [Staphylococcus capitis]